MAVAHGRAGRPTPEGRASAHPGTGTVNGDHDVTRAELEELLAALAAARDGDFAVRLSVRGGGLGADLRRAFNEVADRREAVAKEITRVGRAIGREGRLTERASRTGLAGYWAETLDAFNTVVEDLARPTTEVARVIDAVAQGDLSQKMNLKIEGRPVKGEFLRIGRTVNAMVDQLSSFADEVTRVAREVGTDGKLGGQAKVRGVSGVWKDLTDNVNTLAGEPHHPGAQHRRGDHSRCRKATSRRRSPSTSAARSLELKNTINTMVDQLTSFADEVTRVAREVGDGGQARRPGDGQRRERHVEGPHRVRQRAGGEPHHAGTQHRRRHHRGRGTATSRARSPSTSRARCSSSRRPSTRWSTSCSAFAAEVTRVAREVGTEGKLGGQAKVEGVAGMWKDLTENVNSHGRQPHRPGAQHRRRHDRRRDRRPLEEDHRRRPRRDPRSSRTRSTRWSTSCDAFAAEVTRVAREVGTEGKLGGQAHVEGVSGVWKDLTDNVNTHGRQPDRRRCATSPQVTTAVANGDLSKKITVDVQGEIRELKDTINTMVDQLNVVRLRSHARRARGRHRGQARRPGRRSRASAARGRI